jgi:hypothetical protein
MDIKVILAISALLGGVASSGYGEWVDGEFTEDANSPLSAILLGENEKKLEFCTQAGWASKYECEGIDLWDGGVYSFYAALSRDNLVGTVWYGISSDHRNIAELKYRLDYLWKCGDVYVMPWYEQSFVFPGDHGIPRPGLKLRYQPGDSPWAVGTDTYWQYNNSTFRGYYAVFASWQKTWTPRVTTETLIRYGYNGGYVGPSAPHGSNALDYCLSVSVQLSEQIRMNLFTNFSQALTTLRQRDLGNDFYYGVSLNFSF